VRVLGPGRADPRSPRRALQRPQRARERELRNGIKSYSNWPTIPQLYVKGEFVGGCDIVREMFQAGELQSLMKEKGLPVKANAPA
jgi:glutaredoxin-related protein